MDNYIGIPWESDLRLRPENPPREAVVLASLRRFGATMSSLDSMLEETQLDAHKFFKNVNFEVNLGSLDPRIKTVSDWLATARSIMKFATLADMRACNAGPHSFCSVEEDGNDYTRRMMYSRGNEFGTNDGGVYWRWQKVAKSIACTPDQNNDRQAALAATKRKRDARRLKLSSTGDDK